MAKKQDRTPLLPAAAKAGMRRAALRLTGAIMVFLAAGIAGALLTYAPSDPSFNTASNGPVRNAAGLAGAYVADLALQGLGVGAWILVAGLAGLGAGLFLGRRVHRALLRGITLIVGVVLLSVVLDRVAVPAAWRPDVGLGGWLGHVLNGVLVSVLGGSPLFAGQGALSGFGLESTLFVIRLTSALLGLVALLGTFGVLRWVWGFLRRSLASARPGVPRVRPGRTAGPKAKPRARPKDRKSPTLRPRPQREIADPRIVLPTSVPMTSVPATSVPTAAPVAPEVRPPLPTVSRPADPPPSHRDPLCQDTELALITLPPLRLMTPARPLPEETFNPEELTANAHRLVDVFADFGVRGDVAHVRPGPVVTLYEFIPAPGTKSTRVIGLADDIARIMRVVSARIAVLPGQEAIGVELANAHRGEVRLHDIMAQPSFRSFEGALPLVLGQTIGGDGVIADLASMPHLLIAGTTGSGKSVALNAMILSLLYRLTPRDVRFIMIDPKRLELSIYDGIPHLLAPVVTEPAKAVCALGWVVREMEDRYRRMNALSVRNIEKYNLRVREACANGRPLTRRVQTGFQPDGEPIYEEQIIDTAPLPHIVVVVDEMADLMLTAGKDVEAVMQRLAQMARAAGIHIIMATQRPSVDVVTGTIKANFPSRISFRVASKIDSRTILNEVGAEQLLGQGDMLFMRDGRPPQRVHGPFVSDEDVENVCTFLRDQASPQYIAAVTEAPQDDPVGAGSGAGGGGGSYSPQDNALFDQAVELVLAEGRVSTSFVQRYLKIGYNRAATLVERMEVEGIVSRPNHAGKREILYDNREE